MTDAEIREGGLMGTDGRLAESSPLHGIRVIELASYVFVPSAGSVLAEWGAEVFKIEQPGVGDPSRNTAAWGVPASVNGVAHIFEFCNRGKRSVELNIASEEGRETLMELIANADVFLTNLLPAARQKLRVEPADIWARNPRIVYGRGTAQGARGPLASRGGFDGVTYWGQSGAALGSMLPGQSEPTPMPAPGFGDLQAGMALAGSIGTALYRRERTGMGSVVDVSLLSAGVWAMGLYISGTSVLNVDDLPCEGRAAPPNPLFNVYRTKDDRYISLGFLQPDRFWPEFCLAVDRLEWLSDERFATAVDRRQNAEACVAMLDELFASRGLSDWEQVLSDIEGPWEVLLQPGRVRDYEQACSNGFVQHVIHENGGEIVLVASPAQFDASVPRLGRAPMLGEDTDRVLAEIGRHVDAPALLTDDGNVGA